MAFVNEKIPEADWEKYDIYKINGRWNGAGVPENHWTIDRDQNVWLRLFYREQDHTMPDGGVTGKETWDFYWKGLLMSIDTQKSNGRTLDGDENYAIDLKLLSINIPKEYLTQRFKIISDLKEAFSAYNLYGMYAGKMKFEINFDFGE